MQQEDDDGNEMGNGPPPDPSMREWRHPSEIAAATAAAARPARPRRRWGAPFVTIGGSALAVVSLVGVGLVITARSVDVEPRQEVSTRAARIPASGGAGIDDYRSAGLDDYRSDPGPTTTSLATTTELVTTTTLATTSITLVSSTTTTSTATVESVLPEPGALLDPALRPNETELTDGLFVLERGRLRRKASFVATDGLIFTSASAIEDHQQVALLHEEVWAEATVIGADPFNDLAVLKAVADAPGTVLQGTKILDQSDEPKRPERNNTVTIASPHRRVTLMGTLVGTDTVTARNGVSIYDALVTTVRRPEGSVGSAMLDGDGSLIGVIVDSTGYLAAALPIDRVTDIGRSLLDWGVPALEWLGVKGTTGSGGRVVLAEVAEDSPAAESDLRPGDVVVAVDDVAVGGWDHLVHLIRRSGTGTTISIEIVRDEIRHTVDATVGSRADHVTD